MYGSCGSLPSSSRDPGIPLHRRLVDCFQIGTPSSVGHSLRSPHIAGTGPHYKFREVQAPSFAGCGLHRSEDKFTSSPNVHAPRTHSQNTKSHKEVQTQHKGDGQACSTSPGTHGLHNVDSIARSPQDAFSSGLDVVTVQPTLRQPEQTTTSDTRAGISAPVVDLPASLTGGTPLPTNSADHTSDNRRQPPRLGSPLRRPPNSCAVVLARGETAHKPSGTAGHHQGSEVFSTFGKGQSHPVDHRQHYSHVLCEQTGWDKVQVSPVSRSTSLGMVLSKPHIPCGDSHCDRRQPPCR